MTHRHFKFWRDKKDGNVYSHSLCGVNCYIETFNDPEDYDFKVAMLKWKDTIDPQVVMETTAAPSDCDECESLFGLKILGELGETKWVTLNEVSRGK
jgi:hypothetical protein